jgi:hypothetical protein
VGCTSLQILRPITIDHERTVGAATGERVPTPTRYRHGSALGHGSGAIGQPPIPTPTPFDCGRMVVYKDLTPYA